MIAIPLAGGSARFFDAGYCAPKYMLPAHGRPLFDHAVRSFAPCFGTLPFLFICRADFDTPAFVERRCRALKIARWRTVVLAGPTRGQAETVALGLRQAGITSGSVTIFNIDTIRAGFGFPEFVAEVDGYLEVFRGDGANWSRARCALPDSTVVVETAEKQAISDLCSTGLYHFADVADFLAAFDDTVASPPAALAGAELYVAPLYNHLIAQGRRIHAHRIPREAITFCGVPEEYEAFRLAAQPSKGPTA